MFHFLIKDILTYSERIIKIKFQAKCLESGILGDKLDSEKKLNSTKTDELHSTQNRLKTFF